MVSVTAGVGAISHDFRARACASPSGMTSVTASFASPGGLTACAILLRFESPVSLRAVGSIILIPCRSVDANGTHAIGVKLAARDAWNSCENVIAWGGCVAEGPWCSSYALHKKEARDNNHTI